MNEISNLSNNSSQLFMQLDFGANAFKLDVVLREGHVSRFLDLLQISLHFLSIIDCAVSFVIRRSRFDETEASGLPELSQFV